MAANQNHEQNSQQETASSQASLTPSSLSQDISREPRTTFIQALSLAFIPVLFGSFIFAGLIEEFKDDVSFRRSIMTDAYRPMREAQASYQMTSNNVILKYVELAGTYKTMLNEFTDFLKNQKENVDYNQVIVMQAFVAANIKANDDLAKLQKEKETQRIKLFRSCEDLALMTGTYKIYKSKFNSVVTKINNENKKRQSQVNEATNGIKTDELMVKFKQMLSADYSSTTEKDKMLKNITPVAEATVNINLVISKSEQEIYNIESRFLDEMNSVFADELNKRFKRRFLGLF